jgi:hypothetical protein
MDKRTPLPAVLWMLGTIFTLITVASGQGIQPYPNANTDRLIHLETAMAPPARNVVFSDPDFGEPMVRASDPTTNFKLPGTYLRTEGSGQASAWAADSSKFYMLGKGGQVLVWDFNSTTMQTSSPAGATSGRPLLVPLRPGPSFSFVDPDLIYGTTSPNSLTITSYRFSTAVSAPVIDTRTCGLQPALSTSAISDDDVSVSLDDNRVSISEGGTQSGKHMFVVVYDKKLGCRWYNTQTGVIGGQWGATGLVTGSTSHLIRHAYLSRSGGYVVIQVDNYGWYVWDVSTLNATGCAMGSGGHCGGYAAEGYVTRIDGPAVLDGMQVERRPLSNISQTTQLYYPLPNPANWGQDQHFSWANVDENDSVPVCLSTYSYDGDTTIDQPFAGEIVCVETDGLASTLWRFAHNRAVWKSPYEQTQPLGDVSRDGKFFLFTSSWDGQLGSASDGTPLSDVFIVKLQ